MPFVSLTRGLVAEVDPEDSDLAALKWYANSNGYACRNETIAKGKRRTLLLHRIVLSRKLGRPLLSSEEGDHIDRNRRNNTRRNLRVVNDQQNASNRSVSGRNQSGFKGVSKHRNKWRARIRVKGVLIDLGLHDTPEDAAYEYNKAVRLYHGSYGKGNK